MSAAVPLLHAAVTWFLAGVVWNVQLVQYPLLSSVGAESFRDYHAGHMRRVTWVVAPAMLLEAATALALLVEMRGYPLGLAWVGLVLLGAIWSSTALLQVPLHRKLTRGFDADTHRALVAGNWIRTGCWSVRGILAAWIVML